MTSRRSDRVTVRPHLRYVSSVSLGACFGWNSRMGLDRTLLRVVPMRDEGGGGRRRWREPATMMQV